VLAGIARPARDADLASLLKFFALSQYPVEPKRHWVVIESEAITGRRTPQSWPTAMS
jgi:hypothetical protein